MVIFLVGLATGMVIGGCIATLTFAVFVVGSERRVGNPPRKAGLSDSRRNNH